MTSHIALIDRLPKRALGADSSSEAETVPPGDKVTRLLTSIAGLQQKPSRHAAGQSLTEWYKTTSGQWSDFMDKATLEGILRAATNGCSDISVALNSDGILVVVISFQGKTPPVSPERLDQWTNFGRIVGRLTRVSLGMRQDDALDLIAREGGNTGIEVPPANLPPVCAELSPSFKAKTDNPAVDLLEGLKERRCIWRLGSMGWIAYETTPLLALDDRLDHLLRRHDRALKEAQVRTEDDDQSTDFDVVFRRWKLCSVAFSLCVVVPLVLSGLRKPFNPFDHWAFTAETLALFGLGTLLCGLVPFLLTPKIGLSRETRRRNQANLAWCWMAVFMTLALAVILATNPKPFEVPDVKKAASIAYFYEACLAVIWLLPFLSISLVWWKSTELREERDKLWLSTQAQSTLLAGLEGAIRRNNPSLAEEQVAQWIANQIAPWRDRIARRSADHLNRKAVRDRGYALIAASVAFLGPLNAMKPAFLVEPKPPAVSMTGPLVSLGDLSIQPAAQVAEGTPVDEGPVINGPFLTVGDIRLAPAVRLELSPPVTQVTVESPWISIRTAPLFNLALPLAGRVIADLSVQVKDLASAVRSVPPSTVTVLIGEDMAQLPPPVDGGALARLSGIAGRCGADGPVAQVKFATGKADLQTATFWSRRLQPGEASSVADSLAALLLDPAVAPTASTILLIGHADPTGDAAWNLSLSQRRAQSVATAIAGADPLRKVVPAHGAGSLEWMTGAALAGLGHDLQDARRVDVFVCPADARLAQE